MSTHVSPHTVCVPGHMHDPPTQLWPLVAPHALPQAPQLAGSDCLSTQPLPHQFLPQGHKNCSKGGTVTIAPSDA